MKRHSRFLTVAVILFTEGAPSYSHYAPGSLIRLQIPDVRLFIPAAHPLDAERVVTHPVRPSLPDAERGLQCGNPDNTLYSGSPTELVGDAACRGDQTEVPDGVIEKRGFKPNYANLVRLHLPSHLHRPHRLRWFSFCWQRNWFISRVEKR